MFETFKKLRHQAAVSKWLNQAYDPLFAARDKLVDQLLVISSTVDWLEDFQKQLRTKEDKDPQQIIREKWQALKLEPIIEHYQLAVEKINEALSNIPSRPDKPKKYYVEYYDDTDNPEQF